ncbi:MAG TPA: DUF1329 domain-containing protein [Gemmatimonadaceae bacterium]|nr:DUF1329 domain-containing protein [Gemmatimonadaceae bacterium]
MHRRTPTVLLATALAILAVGGSSALAAAADSPASAATALKPGDVLDSSNWELAKDLLPPEVLDHYRNGEYTNGIVDWPADKYTWPPDLLEGTKANEGRYVIGKEGNVVDATTGVQPDYIIGFPFPKIDPNDPDAGAKVVWNYLYRTWYFGTVHAESQLNFMNPNGLDRRVDVEARYMNFDGVPAEDKVPNPQNLLSQTLAVVTSPSDVSGTAALSWRYRDPDKRDSAWSYVPALRRVRQVSPANRSDGFFGSDLSQDDGPFFDGKPEDFVWKLTGEVEQLRYVDPLSLAGKSNNVWLGEGKGWKAMWPDLHFLGYMDPAWKGIAWAPTTAVLAKRRFYVVEGVPKDRYYLFGKIQLYIDTIAFQGAWNRKYNWQDELLITGQVMAWMPYKAVRPDGTADYIQGSNMAFQCSENMKMHRATVAGIKASPNGPYDAKLKFDPQVFVLDSLSRYGK